MSGGERWRHWLLARATGRWPIDLAARFTRGGAICQGEPRAPLFALTFDDGPDPRWTPGILEALGQGPEPARATFFCVGNAAERHPALVRRAAAAGHEIGTHLWTHGRDAVASDDRFAEELGRSRALLESLAGRPVRHLRFPYGAHGRQRAERLAPHAVRAVHWTVSGHDSRLADPAAIVARVAAALRPGAIVLLHDAIADEPYIRPPYLRTRDATVAALPAILAAARARGLTPVTVAELLAG
jgi:peptidoglycan/xylan/chitin deacetylase (PgdA/CDA1 family)